MWIGAKEAAEIAGVGYETILRWIREEYLPAEKVVVKGRKQEWRIKKSDLLSLIKSSH